MHWIYILQCEDGYYYVGETTRLYRRLREHYNEMGGVNTTTFIPEEIVAIYKVSALCKFLEYDNRIRNKISDIYFNRNGRLLDYFNDEIDEENEIYEFDNLFVENSIVERLMLNNRDNWEKIRGGKYTRLDAEYSFPTNEYIKNLPVCHCGLPCDIRKNENKNYLYFRCAKKNIWPNMKEEFDIEVEPCNYFMKYTLDIEYNAINNQKKKVIWDLTRKSPWLSRLVGGIHDECVGGCGKEYDGDNTVRYSRRAINLCFDCFIHKNAELSKRYDRWVFDDDDD